MKNPLIPALAILGLTSVQGAGAEDLLEIYNLARANDPTYQAAVFRDEANRYELPLAESAFKPSVTTGAKLGQEYSDISGSSETSDDHGFNLNFNLPLYDRVSRTEIQQAEKFTGFSRRSVERRRRRGTNPALLDLLLHLVAHIDTTARVDHHAGRAALG